MIPTHIQPVDWRGLKTFFDVILFVLCAQAC
jgi:hypothetical protein